MNLEDNTKTMRWVSILILMWSLFDTQFLLGHCKNENKSTFSTTNFTKYNISGDDIECSKANLLSYTLVNRNTDHFQAFYPTCSIMDDVDYNISESQASDYR